LKGRGTGGLGPRAALVCWAVAGLALGFGLGVGLRFSGFDSPARAAGAVAAPDFAAVARRATPAVVNISALQVLRSARSPFFSEPFFGDFFGGTSPFRMPQEERKTSLGSGVLVSADGLVVTNNHVIDNARQIAVTLADRRRLEATLVGTDPVTDIALLRVDSQGLPFLPWGDSARAAVGEYVLAIGNPFQLNQTVTMGIISATGRSNVGIVDYEDFIQTDAAINPGNSGGALVDTRGTLIGINTAIYSETGGYQGIGFAVPAALARKVVQQLAERGHVARGFLGIWRIGEVADERTARRLGLPRDTRGALVVELLRGSPAERAGIQPGDVIVAIGDRPVESAAELRHELAGAEVGTRLRVRLRRAARTHEVDVPVEEWRGER
jgi:Do/DeqQ family serine protease